jgi:hypothetical protein
MAIRQALAAEAIVLRLDDEAEMSRHMGRDVLQLFKIKEGKDAAMDLMERMDEFQHDLDDAMHHFFPNEDNGMSEFFPKKKSNCQAPNDDTAEPSQPSPGAATALKALSVSLAHKTRTRPALPPFELYGFPFDRECARSQMRTSEGLAPAASAVVGEGPR